MTRLTSLKRTFELASIHGGKRSLYQYINSLCKTLNLMIYLNQFKGDEEIIKN